MEIIVDTSVIIAGEKGSFDFESWVASQVGDDFAISAVTVAELWEGVERASAKAKTNRQQYIETVTSAFEVYPYTRLTALIHAKLSAALKISGLQTGPYDLIIAATALQRSAAVATFDVRHFARFPGLAVIQPTGLR